ncbi:radical SAM/SPASM domain-containing protein [Kitasatospora sp. NPDC088134]|uniref:radical SAM/SPASM domain-containing protein n=1 Tax=Kitasatospora sp. NPDC088134 TaxID=3364071 RepID=UPI0037F4F88D
MRSIVLDLTRACQANCTTCYNNSGPAGGHGQMSGDDWRSVVLQAAAAGARQVQFIGGEPTLHPELPDLLDLALAHGMRVEVFSNLIHVRAALWPVLRRPGVMLATSYYSDRADEHEAITRHRGSYTRTRANIARAMADGIPVRAAVVHVLEGQRVEQAVAELHALGVTDVRVDPVRAIGRAAPDGPGPGGREELCGHCARGRAAVLPDGSVAACVMSGTMMSAGNVRCAPLAQILAGPQWAELAASIPRPAGPGGRGATACNPNQDGSDCAPAETEACGPAY